MQEDRFQDSRLIESDFRHPALRLDAAGLRRRFAGGERPLRNPHHEPRVTSEERERAVPAAVLVPVVLHPEPSLLLTRRHGEISFGGHICFPGGRADPTDASSVATALREAREEIGMESETVEVLGRLGDYVTHSGFRIAPIVGLVEPPLALQASPNEVDEILEVPLSVALDSASYLLYRHETVPPRAHYVLRHDEAYVTGPTVSILMGFYESLL